MLYDYLPNGVGSYLNKKPDYRISDLIDLQITKYVICIDGLAGAGKSTLGKRLSNILVIPHISSGIFYRIFTYIFCVYHIEFSEENIDKITDQISFEINNNELDIFYNNKKIAQNELKNDVIDAALNRYSSNLYFRASITTIITKMVQNLQSSFILDLRGSNPPYVQAILDQNRPVIRLLLVADPVIKAQRRVKEYTDSKYSKDQYYNQANNRIELFNQILTKIIERDNQDIESIKKTNIGLIEEDTGIIDTGEISEEQVMEISLNYINNSLKSFKKI